MKPKQTERKTKTHYAFNTADTNMPVYILVKHEFYNLTMLN